MHDMMPAEQIRQLRRRSGLTQEDFAQAIGVRTREIGRWEKGSNSPGPMARERLRAFAAELRPVSD